MQFILTFNTYLTRFFLETITNTTTATINNRMTTVGTTIAATEKGAETAPEATTNKINNAS